MISKTISDKVEDVGRFENLPSTENETYMENPIQFSALGENCTEYEVIAKSFISTCCQEMDERVLDATRGIIKDASGCQDASLQKGTEPPAPNPNNPEQWHHRYSVSFKVLAKDDPKDYLNDFLSKNILQLGDAAVRIAYVETNKLTD